MFKVIEKYNQALEPSDNTIHYINRIERLKVYKHLLSDEMIQCFVVDTDHRNGLEIHCINEYGLIYIYNKLSLRLITILHPRPKQLKRYYQQLGLTISKEIKEIIKENKFFFN